MNFNTEDPPIPQPMQWAQLIREMVDDSGEPDMEFRVCCKAHLAVLTAPLVLRGDVPDPGIVRHHLRLFIAQCNMMRQAAGLEA